MHYLTASPGVGKTHLSVALAEAAIPAGLGACFIPAHDLATDLGRAYREGRLDRQELPNIVGEIYRLKDRRKAGLVPPRERERAVASQSLASASLATKTRQKAALGSLRPRPRRPIHELQRWGIFDRRKGEFSSGVD
jgi:hypothetical protein